MEESETKKQLFNTDKVGNQMDNDQLKMEQSDFDAVPSVVPSDFLKIEVKLEDGQRMNYSRETMLNKFEIEIFEHKLNQQQEITHTDNINHKYYDRTKGKQNDPFIDAFTEGTDLLKQTDNIFICETKKPMGHEQCGDDSSLNQFYEITAQPNTSSPAEHDFVELYQPFVTTNSDPLDSSSEAEEMGVCDYESGNKRGRKRKIPSQSRQDRKKRVNSNMSYVSANNKVVEPRRFNAEYTCPCSKKCHTIVDNDTRKRFFDQFWGVATFEGRCVILSKCVEEIDKKRCYTKNKLSKRSKTRIYKINDHKVCKFTFLNTLQINPNRIRLALDQTKDNFILDKRGKSSGGWNAIDKKRILEVKKHISSFPTYITHCPCNQTTPKFLHSNLTLPKMYNLYKETTNQPVSISKYKQVFYGDFKLKLSTSQKDTTCRSCDTYYISVSPAHETDKSNLKKEAAEGTRSEMKNSEIRNTLSKNFKGHKCPECSFQTKLKGNLTRHLIRHKNPDEVQKYSCSECDFQTRHRSALDRHRILHKNPQEIEMFKCDECSYESIHKDNLKKHSFVHKNPLEIQIFTCEQCGWETKREGSLKRHRLLHKSPDEVHKFQCNQCPFQTIHRRSLTGHLLIHRSADEVVKYKCEHCEFETIHKGRLKKHQIIHKSLFEIEMHKCNECGFQSIHSSSLKKHLIVHKNPLDVDTYMCEQCGFRTIHKKSLKDHLGIHNTEKLKCPECDFQTSTKGGIRSHLRVHKKPQECEVHKCLLCGFQTIHKSSFRKHLRKHQNS